MVIYVRLKNPGAAYYFQSILGTYSHLVWIRSEEGEEGVIKLFTTDNLVDDLKKVLDGLKKEVEFEVIQG